MSRLKSPAAIQRQLDKDIRQKRCEWKRRERERRKAEREERRKRRESARNGAPVLVKPDPEPDLSFRSLRSYHPLRFCESCRQIKREDWMHSETVCLGCHYDEGGRSERHNNRREQGNASEGALGRAPFDAEKRKGMTQLHKRAGQLLLEI
jgi:hypothetical protein